MTREPEQVTAWCIDDAQRPLPGRAELVRHHRKYAEGDLRWHSFYFRGPDGRHNLKAQNLAVSPASR